MYKKHIMSLAKIKCEKLRDTLKRARDYSIISFSSKKTKHSPKCYDCIEGLCRSECRRNYFPKPQLRRQQADVVRDLEHYNSLVVVRPGVCAWCTRGSKNGFCSTVCFEADQLFWETV